MDLNAGIRFNRHSRMQMRERGVTEAQVEQALRLYHISYPAEPAPFDPMPATVYVADVDGRTLKVYVEDGSHPPPVKTVVWRDD
jgi:hypothetical protein